MIADVQNDSLEDSKKTSKLLFELFLVRCKGRAERKGKSWREEKVGQIWGKEQRREQKQAKG